LRLAAGKESTIGQLTLHGEVVEGVEEEGGDQDKVPVPSPLTLKMASNDVFLIHESFSTSGGDEGYECERMALTRDVANQSM
jgi:hypothetical protein